MSEWQALKQHYPKMCQREKETKFKNEHTISELRDDFNHLSTCTTEVPGKGCERKICEE